MLFFRFRVVIQQVQELGEHLFGIRNFQMKLKQIYHILEEASYLWRIRVRILMAHSCMFRKNFRLFIVSYPFLYLYSSFITYRSCRHLDGKHTIFGKLVGGLEVLTEMEKIEVDNKDRPITKILIEKAQVFVDPFQEADEELASERANEIERTRKEEEDKIKKKERSQPMKVFRPGVGKYLNTAQSDKPSTSSGESTSKIKKKDAQSYQFGNFNSW